MTAVCEYFTAEMVELSGTIANAQKRSEILKQDLAKAIADDDELAALFPATAAQE